MTHVFRPAAVSGAGQAFLPHSLLTSLWQPLKFRLPSRKRFLLGADE